MDNDLNSFFLTIDIYQGDTKVKTVTVPKSLIHDIFQQYKFPGSRYDIKVLDHTGNFRIDSKIMGF
jgi:hypothetical protein